MKDTPRLREYNDAIDISRFMRAQACAIIESADQIEKDARRKAEEYVGKQPESGLLLPLTYRIMVKELGHEVSMDGPLPNTDGGDK